MDAGSIPAASNIMDEEIDKDMLLFLVCPLTGGKLIWDKEHHELICHTSKLAYPVRDGVPVLRYDHARELMEKREDK